MEKDIERALVNAVSARNFLTFKFLCPERGVPDRIVIAEGKVVFVELKNGNRGRLSKLQEWQHKRIRAAGASVYVVRTVEEAKDFAAGLPGLKDGETENDVQSVRLSKTGYRVDS